jgi:hypothetical protein
MESGRVAEGGGLLNHDTKDPFDRCIRLMVWLISGARKESC